MNRSLFLLLTLAGSILWVGGVQAEELAHERLPELMPEVQRVLDKHYDDLEQLYKHLHANPELSYQEEKTSARLAEELRKLGFTVTERVGGYGVVGVLKNGNGPTVMVRADMDALPVIERTGLPYASKVRVKDAEGRDIGVMHACGHDMHMACWVGTARVLTELKDRWSGTLVFIGQPAEERGGGAKAMLEDGLYTRFPKPDYALALHCDGYTPHGVVAVTEGLALANVDSVDIIVKGQGGHGSAPHTTIDPIVIAARIVLDLQTLVSRETDPLDSAVVTVGSIHGGTKHNIIPNEVKMQLTVRSFKTSVRHHLLKGIERIAKAAAQAARAPEPEVIVHADEFTPAMVNDVRLTRKTAAALRKVLGEDCVVSKPPMMGGEDFSRFGLAGVPICMFRLGTESPKRLEEAANGGRPVPSMHSDTYYPVVEPTLKTGVQAMSAAVLNLLAK
ncbi:MAG: amidohydrolase [Gemmatales bacterium]|nr:amidohydrolase [Gemmatales bacterium]MDW8388351.1 amidohydrolase [Gemmatales bacterium]